LPLINYFAYGSNLDRMQMQTRCKSSTFYTVASLSDFELSFSHYSSGWGGGVADIRPKQNKIVWGAIYKITDQDLEELDRYEGFPDIYIRNQFKVETTDSTLETVFAYQLRVPKEFTPPSTRYLDVLVRSAVELGFPNEYLAQLNSIQAMTG